MSEVGKRLIGAAKEAGQIARGEAEPSTYKTDPPRTKSDRIARLRTRLKAVQNSSNADRQLRDIIVGVLDLLEDEL